MRGELHTDAQKDHCSPGSQHEKQLPNPPNFLPGAEKEWHHDRQSDKQGVTSVE